MYTIVPRGSFSLEESARFAFIDRDPEPFQPGSMRIAFCRDGSLDPKGPPHPGH